MSLSQRYGRTMDRQEEIDFNRTITRSIVENDTEWKKIRALLRKDGVITTYAAQQFILKEVVDQRLHKYNAGHDEHSTNCSKSNYTKKSQDQDNEHRGDDIEVCRRLSATSVDRVVKKLLRSNDRESSLRSMRRLSSCSASSLKSLSSSSSAALQTSSSSKQLKKSSISSRPMSLAELAMDNRRKSNANAVWDSWTGPKDDNPGSPKRSSLKEKFSANLYSELDALAVLCPSGRPSLTKAEKLRGSLETALNLVALEDELWK